jgi:hypothetical protein
VGLALDDDVEALAPDDAGQGIGDLGGAHSTSLGSVVPKRLTAFGGSGTCSMAVPSMMSSLMLRSISVSASASASGDETFD